MNGDKSVMSDPAGTLANFSANLRFDDIPVEVIDRLKQRVLDTLACALGGHSGHSEH